MSRRTVSIVVVVVILGIQLIPVDREGAPPAQPLQAPAEVMGVLERSCYDCHSAETTWPWYGYVAPVSWYVAHDVAEAREHLDFSRWGLLSAPEQAKLQQEIVEEVDEGEMPLPQYLRLHAEARVTPSDREILRRWAGTSAGGGSHERAHDH